VVGWCVDFFLAKCDYLPVAFVDPSRDSIPLARHLIFCVSFSRFDCLVFPDQTRSVAYRSIAHRDPPPRLPSSPESQNECLGSPDDRLSIHPSAYPLDLPNMYPPIKFSEKRKNSKSPSVASITENHPPHAGGGRRGVSASPYRSGSGSRL